MKKEREGREGKGRGKKPLIYIKCIKICKFIHTGKNFLKSPL
jgi:hypothetical protein